MRENDADLVALTRARPDELDPARLAGSRRQHEDLAAILSTDRPASTARRRTYRWVAIPVAGVAVAVAGAVVVTGTLSGAPAPAHSSAPAHTGPDGRVVLLNMAGAIEHETGSGNYWQQNTSDGYVSVVPGATPYTVLETQKETWSIGVRPGEKSLWTGQIDQLSQPRTATDKSRWQAAGSPKTVIIDEGATKADGTTGTLQMPIGPGHEISSRTDTDGDIVAVGPNNVDYAYLQRLPGTQSGLTALFDQLYQQDGNGEDADDRTGWMLQQAAGLAQLPVSGNVRASAFRLIAALPGVQSLGTVTDALGRSGVGVALPAQAQGDLGTSKQELIVDPRTNTVLAEETVIVTPSTLASAAGLTEGTVLNYQATTEIGWTNQS